MTKRTIQEIEADARSKGLAAMWRRPGMRAHPASKCPPQHWSYADVKSFLLEAAPEISPEDCERRVLILESKGMPDSWYMSPTLFAGVQMLLPGETAAAHRHTQAAMRFAFEGAGVYAAVDGERLPVEPGDLLLTPRWAWHDHGHEGIEPALWLDVLDVPLVAHLEAEFREWSNSKTQTVATPSGSSEAMFGHGLRPVDAAGGYLKRYPYKRAREAIAHLLRTGQVDPRWGAKLEYTDPGSGNSILPAISAFLQGLPKGFKTQRRRTTETTLLVLVEGAATVTAGETTYTLQPKDMVLIPSWTPLNIESSSETILFSVSNKPLLQKLDLWRELMG